MSTSTIRTRWDHPTDIELRPRASTIAVIGAGGHGRELADIVRETVADDDRRQLLGVADDGNPDLRLLARMGHRFIGTSAAVYERDELDILIGIGDPAIRERIDATDPLRAAPPLVHPSASVGSANAFAPGVVLAQGTIVTTNVRLGRHTHLNVASSVSHDCVVGDFVTICPGVRLTGNVEVGDRVFIGTGAVVIPGVRIGSDITIGAGAVVTRDVPDGSLVKGIPAR